MELETCVDVPLAFGSGVRQKVWMGSMNLRVILCVSMGEDNIRRLCPLQERVGAHLNFTGGMRKKSQQRVGVENQGGQR